MKKLFYTIALLSIIIIAATSCTQEEVKPVRETNNTGGGVSDKF